MARSPVSARMQSRSKRSVKGREHEPLALRMTRIKALRLPFYFGRLGHDCIVRTVYGAPTVKTVKAVKAVKAEKAEKAVKAVMRRIKVSKGFQSTAVFEKLCVLSQTGIRML
ncbi:MAG: hypothetical protein ACJASJ_000238 [Candidatus Azotimanducaceae bacterium]|jgi:hypothetical protein